MKWAGLGIGQRVALFAAVILLLTGIGVGMRPLGHAYGVPISGFSVSCGSAFFPLGNDANAVSNVGNVCAQRQSAWRYPAIALLVAAGVVALAGFFIFRRPAQATQ